MKTIKSIYWRNFFQPTFGLEYIVNLTIWQKFYYRFYWIPQIEKNFRVKLHRKYANTILNEDDWSAWLSMLHRSIRFKVDFVWTVSCWYALALSCVENKRTRKMVWSLELCWTSCELAQKQILFYKTNCSYSVNCKKYRQNTVVFALEISFTKHNHLWISSMIVHLRSARIFLVCAYTHN